MCEDPDDLVGCVHELDLHGVVAREAEAGPVVRPTGRLKKMLLTTGPSLRRCWVKTIAPAVAASSSATTTAEIRTTDRLRSLTGRPG